MWHKKFIAGIFDDAYRISKKLYDNLPNICSLFDLNDDIAGRIYSAHGLSLKMLEGGIAATRLLTKELKNILNLITLVQPIYRRRETVCLRKTH